jgi:hypothetical protein
MTMPGVIAEGRVVIANAVRNPWCVGLFANQGCIPLTPAGFLTQEGFEMTMPGVIARNETISSPSRRLLLTSQ